MTTVPLTGFEPFAGAASNSSWDAVERVAETWSGDAELVIELLPVTFAGLSPAVRAPKRQIRVGQFSRGTA